MRIAPYKNFILLLFGRGVDYIITLALLSGIARFLGNETLGIYYFSRSIASMVAPLSEFGLSRFAIRLLADQPGRYRDVIGYLFAIRTSLTTLALISIYCGTLVMDVDKVVVNAIILIALGLGLFQIADLFLDSFRAREAMQIPVLLNMMQRLLYVGFCFLGLLSSHKLTWVLTVFVVTNLLHIIVSGSIVFRRFWIPRYSLKYSELRTFFVNASPFMTVVVLATIKGRIDVLLLYYFFGDVTVGFYGSSMHIIEGLLYIAYACTTAAFPSLVRTYSSSPIEFLVGVRTVIKVLLLVIAPIACGTVIAAKAIITFLYGPDFFQSVIVLQICVCAVVPAFFNAFFISHLQATGKHTTATYLMVLFVLVHGVVSLLLIPKYGAPGAAFAFFFSELFIFAGHVYFAKDLIYSRNIYESFLKVVASILVMVFVTVTLTRFGFILQLTIGGLAYIGLLILMKPFSYNEVHWMRASLRSTLSP